MHVILYAGVVGKESFVGGVTSMKTLLHGDQKNSVSHTYHPWTIEFIDTSQTLL